METIFLEKVKLSREQALAKDRIVTLNRSDLLKTPKISYSWYQTDFKIGIDIPIFLEKKDFLKTNFQEDKMFIQFPTQSGLFSF